MVDLTLRISRAEAMASASPCSLNGCLVTEPQHHLVCFELDRVERDHLTRTDRTLHGRGLVHGGVYANRAGRLAMPRCS